MEPDDVKGQPAVPTEERKREAAEAVREAAEQLRTDAEARRATAEGVRLAAERVRIHAETARATTVADVNAAAEGLTAILDEMKTVEAMRRARRALTDSDDPQTH